MPPPRFPISFRILGPLTIEVDGRAASVGRLPRALAMRLLVASGDVVPVDRLVDDLWAGEPPASAVNTLQSYVSVLRRTFGPAGRALLVRDGPGYRIAVDPDALDATRFERLALRGHDLVRSDPAQALELLDAGLAEWRGPALVEAADQPWALPVATHLEELRLAAGEDRFDALLALGRHAEAVGEIERKLADHPLRERLAGQLMVALYRCGRQADALDAFQRTRRHLAEELGLDPTPELARLETAILEHDPLLARPDPPEAPGAAAAPAAPPGAAPGDPGDRPADGSTGLPLPAGARVREGHSPLVGRAAELEQLEAAWRRVAEGDRLLVLLAGEPGIGKTRLAAELAARAHGEHWVVLWGRCPPDPLGPYVPVAEALREAFLHLDEARALRLSRSRGALVRLVPELGERFPELTPPAVDDPAAGRYLLFQAIAGLLEETSNVFPVLLVVDDLQWADASTVRLLGHLLRPEGSGRLLVVGTLRWPVDPPNEPFADLVADLRRDRTMERITLDGLSEPAVAALVAAAGGDAAGAMPARLHSAAGGNPFFVEELIAHLLESGVGDDALGAGLPPSVLDVLGRRIDRLGETVGEVLESAAVVGPAADLGLLAEALHVDHDAVVAAAERAGRAGLLIETAPDLVAFPHALVRQTLLERLGATRRARLHARVADAIERRRPTRPDQAGELARHLLAAGPGVAPERVAHAVTVAAEVALDTLDFEEALTYAERAREVLRACDDGVEASALRARVALADGVARWGLNDLAAASTQYEAAFAFARRAGDHRLLARAAEAGALAISGFGFQFAMVDRALVERIEEALAAQPEEATSERARLLSLLVPARLLLDEPARLLELAEDSRRLALEAGDDAALAAALLAIRQANWQPARLDERLAVGPEAVARADCSRNATLPMRALVLHAADLYEAGRASELAAVLERLRAELEVTPLPVYRGYLLFLDASLAGLRGEYETAEALAEEAMRVAGEQLGTGAPLAQFGLRLQSHTEHGRMAEIVGQLEQLVEALPLAVTLKTAFIGALLAAGRVEEAQRMFDELVPDSGPALEEDSLWMAGAVHLAEMGCLLGDRRGAAVLHRALAPYADRMAIGGLGGVCLGPVARWLARLATVLGRYDEAEEHLDRAECMASDFGARPVLARLPIDRAELLEARGRPGDAEEAARMRGAGTEAAEALGIALL